MSVQGNFGNLTGGGGADWAFFDIPASQVSSTIGFMSQRADQAIERAYSVLDKLGEFAFDQETGAPNYTLNDPGSIPVVSPTPPDGSLAFGSVYTPTAPGWEDVWADVEDVELDVGEFSPKTGPITMPAKPSPMNVTPPADRNFDFGGVPFPGGFNFVDPEMGDVHEIRIPEFVFPTIPVFNINEPTFDDQKPSTNITWSEPAYSSQLLSQLQAKVREWLAGGTGLPPAIQQALFDAARERELQTASEAEDAALSTWAARGFDMPPGMLVEQVDIARDKSRMAQNTLSREILVKSQEWEIENLRFAVERGIAMEGLLQQTFNAAAQRSFEVAKARVDADVALYNVMATVFNAKSSAYQARANVYKVEVDAALAGMEAYKYRIQGEQAKAGLNEITVKVYEGRVRAIQARAEAYKAEMEGAKAQIEGIKAEIDAYKSSIDAYSARVVAEKARFEVYGEEVRAEAAKAGMFEAEARAFAATVSAAEAKVNVKGKYAEARASATRASAEKFVALVEAEKLATTSSVSAVQASAEAYRADVSRYSAEIEAESLKARTDSTIAELRNRNNIAMFETAQKAYEARMARMIEQAKILVEALKAAGQISSALGQGAMSAIHVQASMSGTGHASSSNQYQRSYSENHHYNHEG